jgi:two-component system, LytTR family, response regulator
MNFAGFTDHYGCWKSCDLIGPDRETYREVTINETNEKAVLRQTRFRVLLAGFRPLELILRRILEADSSMVIVAQSLRIDELPLLTATCAPDILIMNLEERSSAAAFEFVECHSIPAAVLIGNTHGLAAKAFECGVVDYVLRPFTEQRIAQSIERAKLSVHLGQVSWAKANSRGSGSMSLSRQPANRALERFVVHSGKRRLVLQMCQIDFLRASGNYVLIYSDKAVHRMRGNIGDVMGKLDPFCFCRIHRSTIVNRERIVEVITKSSHGPVVKLESGVEIRISRTYAREIFTMLSLRNPL